MARLAIDRDFLDDYSKLPKSVQASVKSAIDKFAEHVHAGLHLEKLSQSKDDRIRTIRVGQSWRGVVLAPDAGDTYSLIRVMPHDKAIDYCVAAPIVKRKNMAAHGTYHTKDKILEIYDAMAKAKSDGAQYESP